LQTRPKHHREFSRRFFTITENWRRSEQALQAFGGFFCLRWEPRDYSGVGVKGLSWGFAAVAKVILVVDDDAGVRETAVELVESLGYRVESASNAHDALLCIQSEKVDAVLTDVMMPGMSGFELAKRIHAADPDIPIICATGYASESPPDFVILLQKPYRADTIAKALDSRLMA